MLFRPKDFTVHFNVKVGDLVRFAESVKCQHYYANHPKINSVGVIVEQTGPVRFDVLWADGDCYNCEAKALESVK